MRYRILVLGGYGIFGQRIAKRLAQRDNIHVIIAGRDRDKALAYKQALLSELPQTSISTQQCDVHNADSLTHAIKASRCQLVINTCGPFQSQDYVCPVTAIKNNVHYIDLADARDYVCGFHKLNELAQRYGVLAITGASSVPALSGAIVDAIASSFQHIETIDIGINPGNQTPRGIATVRSILSYCGKPFLSWQHGKWQPLTGWQSLSRRVYPQPMGKRWLSNCDIPDLTLFHNCYPDAKSIRFQAGLELGLLHLGTWLLSWCVRWGWLNNAARYANGLKHISEWFYRFGSTIGGMHVEVTGRDQQQRLRNTWYLIAQHGHGPQVPCTAAVILAEKFAAGLLHQTGADTCLDYITKAEFEQAFAHYDMQIHELCEAIPSAYVDRQSTPSIKHRQWQLPAETTPWSTSNAPMPPQQ